MHNNQLSETDEAFTLKHRIWLSGTSAWLFGITDRTIAATADGYLSTTDITQLVTVSLLLLGWLFLKPKKGLAGKSLQSSFETILSN